VKELGLAGRYILCVNNLCAHKNLGQLMGGYSLVRERFPDVRLVLAGAFSDNVSGICDNPWGLALSRDVQRAHVRGMGLVSDEDLAALMQCSEFLVNPSLSEANNGPGLDAWEQGVPVAMSSIPPFLEHIDFLGVRAELFHPRCLYQIRDALLNLLENPGLAQENARHSFEMMKKWTWTEIAQRYAQVFGAAAGKS
jgi:glycosyltransferase involved in cell wall biosynthesis